MNALARDPLPPLIESDPFQADRATVERYARLTNDFNPIHVDEAFARDTPFGGTIAHGTLSLALLVEAVERALPPAWRMAGLDIRWTAPLPVGSTVTARAERAGDGYAVSVTSARGVETLKGSLRVVERSA